MRVLLGLVFNFLIFVSIFILSGCAAGGSKSKLQTHHQLPNIKQPVNKKNATTSALARKQAQEIPIPQKVEALTPAAVTAPQPPQRVLTPYAYLQEADLYLKNSTDPAAAESYRIKSAELIEGHLSQDELTKLGEDFSDNSLRAHAYYRLGQIGLENHDQEMARKFFGKSLNAEPNSEMGKKAQELLSQLEASRKVESKTIGVVLPLTGKFSNIAQKTLRGVEMGLGLYGNNISSFKLAVVDSEGNPDSARHGVERLVKEDNAIAIIGSVLSKNSSAVAAKSAELGVPSITLAQKSGVTDISPTVFRNALTSEMQVRHLVRTAIDSMGLKKFAILFPNDQYGIEFSNIFWDEVLARGGKITAAQSYAAKETDFRYSIQRLVGTYYLEDRLDEYNVRLKEWSDQQPKKSARNTPPEDLLPAIVDFDAIFIPDGAKSLGQIAAMLSFNGVKGSKLLGTNLWNVPDIAKRAGVFSKDLLFVDTISPSDPAFKASSFVRDYKSLFGEDPGVFEIQGYDSALALRQLIMGGASSREGLTYSLSKLNELPGSVGFLSMTDDREILRPIQALTVQANEIVPYKK